MKKGRMVRGWVYNHSGQAHFEREKKGLVRGGGTAAPTPTPILLSQGAPTPKGVTKLLKKRQSEWGCSAFPLPPRNGKSPHTVWTAWESTAPCGDVAAAAAAMGTSNSASSRNPGAGGRAGTWGDPMGRRGTPIGWKALGSSVGDSIPIGCILKLPGGRGSGGYPTTYLTRVGGRGPPNSGKYRGG